MTKRLCRQIGFGKPLLFWGFSLAFGLSRRTSMCSALSSHILSLLYNQYYFIFAILPILLFFCGSVMEDDPIIFVLRYGSYKHYFTSKWRSLGVLCSGLWLGQITILFVTGAGLSVIKQGWDNFSGSSLLKEIAPLLVKSFPGAWVAVFCAAVYMLMGYWLIALLTLWLGYFLQRQKAIKVLLALYILTILSIKLPIMSRPPFCYLTGINHWVLLLHNLTAGWRFPLTVIVTLLFVVTVICSIQGGWRSAAHHHRISKGLPAYYRHILFSASNFLVLAISLALLVGWVWCSGGVPIDGREWVIRLLAGHGTGYFYPLGFMALLLAELLPLWPVGRFLIQATSENSALLMIRSKRRNNILRSLLCVSTEWIACCCVSLLMAEVIPIFALNYVIPVELVLEATMLRFLDMVFQFLIIFLFLCLNRNPTFGFLVVVLLHLLSLLPIPWLPVGASSLLRLRIEGTGGTSLPVTTTVELVVCNLILLTWIWYYGARYLFGKVEVKR